MIGNTFEDGNGRWIRDIFRLNDREALRAFCIRWSAADASIDTLEAYNLARKSIKYYKGDESMRYDLRSFQELENRWYQSLKDQKPDYSVYSDKYILSDIWACWVIYSRKYLLAIQNKKSLGNKSIVDDMKDVNTVIDLGCGFGYTTAGLKQIFQGAEVYGTNIKDTAQYKTAQLVGKEFGFQLIPNLKKFIGQIDLVFASEYFEHIEDPVAHLLDIIENLSPKYLIIANSFGTTSLGHFYFYPYKGIQYSGKAISRIFNETLRASGYEKVQTKLWNSRPTYWRKI